MSHRKFRAPRHGSLGFLVSDQWTEGVGSLQPVFLHEPAADLSLLSLVCDNSPRRGPRSTGARSAPSPRWDTGWSGRQAGQGRVR